MRSARIKETGAAFYHIMSRVVDRRMIFDSDEKERFRELMRACEAFCAVQVVTWAVLDNHFHILLHVPARQMVSDEELVQRLESLYGTKAAREVERKLQRYRQAGEHEAAERLKGRYTRRMYDLSEFAKTLKQRLTQSYNRRHRRKGTLWEERFKSIIVQGARLALLTAAAYIDLNAVRARMVADPKDYRFSGYGEALGGSADARGGLGLAMSESGRSADWARVSAEYRIFLYGQGQERGRDQGGEPLSPGIPADQVAAVLARGGELSRAELLRCRVRYFTDGAVLGSRAYVDEVLERHRSLFGRKRRSISRPMRGGAVWGDLTTARHLRLDPICRPEEREGSPVGGEPTDSSPRLASS